MRLQRKHDAQNRGKREQRTTRNKNTVIHGVRIAAIRNRRATWRGTCRSPTAQQPQRKPDTVSGRARKARKWRRMQPTRLPGDRRSGGRRSRIPVRTGCGRQENESPHPQCHPAFFTPHAHPGKSKTFHLLGSKEEIDVIPTFQLHRDLLQRGSLEIELPINPRSIDGCIHFFCCKNPIFPHNLLPR